MCASPAEQGGGHRSTNINVSSIVQLAKGGLLTLKNSSLYVRFSSCETSSLRNSVFAERENVMIAVSVWQRMIGVGHLYEVYSPRVSSRL